MNTYEISFTEFPKVGTGEPYSGRAEVVSLGEHEGRSARAVLDAFTAEKGVAGDYTHGNRNSVWGLGCPTLHARKVNA